MQKLNDLLEWGGTRRDAAFLVFSGAALLLSIFAREFFPIDPAWAAILLCGVPILLEAVIGLVTAFNINPIEKSCCHNDSSFFCVAPWLGTRYSARGKPAPALYAAVHTEAPQSFSPLLFAENSQTSRQKALDRLLQPVFIIGSINRKLPSAMIAQQRRIPQEKRSERMRYDE